MPHSIEPKVGKKYFTHDGKSFVVKSFDNVDVVIEDSAGTRVFMSNEAWGDLRLDMQKTAAAERK